MASDPHFCVCVFFAGAQETSYRIKRHQEEEKHGADEKVLDEDNLEKLLKLLLTFVAIK